MNSRFVSLASVCLALMASLPATASDRFFTVQLAAGVTPDQLTQLKQKVGDTVPLTLVQHQGMLKVWSGRYQTSREAAGLLAQLRASVPGVFIRQVNAEDIQSSPEFKNTKLAVSPQVETPATQATAVSANSNKPSAPVKEAPAAVTLMPANVVVEKAVTASAPIEVVIQAPLPVATPHPWLLQIEDYAQQQNWIYALPVAYAIESNPNIAPTAAEQRLMGWVYYHNGYYEAARELFTHSLSRQASAETEAALAQAQAQLRNP